MPNDQKQAIMDQVVAAFGAGAGAVRVERAALAVLRAHYEPMITDDVLRRWEQEAVQALERVRVIGSRASQRMVGDARSSINEGHVRESIQAVEAASLTSLCNPG